MPRASTCPVCGCAILPRCERRLMSTGQVACINCARAVWRDWADKCRRPGMLDKVLGALSGRDPYEVHSDISA
jgi:hypothetical protein